MIATARFVSWFALAGTIVPSMLFFADRLPLERMRLWMLLATVVWFAAAPLWMDKGD